MKRSTPLFPFQPRLGGYRSSLLLLLSLLLSLTLTPRAAPDSTLTPSPATTQASFLPLITRR